MAASRYGAVLQEFKGNGGADTVKGTNCRRQKQATRLERRVLDSADNHILASVGNAGRSMHSLDDFEYGAALPNNRAKANQQDQHRDCL
jgi:hypothetical protein